jgi:hypothetical protein
MLQPLCLPFIEDSFNIVIIIENIAVGGKGILFNTYIIPLSEYVYLYMTLHMTPLIIE